MSGQHTTIAFAIPRATRPPGRYISIRLGPPDGPPITLSPSSLDAGMTGQAYSETLTASGGASPYSFTISAGVLPAGVSLASDGELTGEPTTAGIFSFTARAQDSTPVGLGGPYAGTRAYTLTINQAPWRGLMSAVGARWVRQAAVHRALLAEWDRSAPHSAQLAAGWARSALVDRILAARWGQVPQLSATPALAWDRSGVQQCAVGAGWSGLIPLDSELELPWARRASRSATIGAPFESPPAQRVDIEAPWAIQAAVQRAIGSDWLTPPYRHLELELPWKQGTPAPWRIRLPDEETPPPPPPPARDGRFISLRFACPRRTESTRYLTIPFSPWQCYTGRIHPRVITVINTVSIVRVGDDAPIAATQFSLRGDLESPLWQFSMAIANAASFDLLKPGPSGVARRIRVTINGHAWVFLVELPDEVAGFGDIRRSATGRSITAMLTRDYAVRRTRTQTLSRTAQQLADEELDGTGYTVDWQGPSWVVPGGVWSYVDLAPLDALRAIADACGCVLQSHPTDPVIQVVPAFRARPWVWSTTAPDVDLVDDYLLRRSTGTAMGVRHNAVEVRGEMTGGIRGQVRITGTAGDIALPQVADPLITAYAAAEARGIRELSQVGPIGKVAIELPLFNPATSPGLVSPGMLARLSGELMTRALGVSIAASSTDNGGLYVRQSLELERHYDA